MRQESRSSITTFDELSSGEQQLLTLALKLTAYASDSTVILVDEPELSLHVSWQRAIPVMLEIIGSRILGANPASYPRPACERPVQRCPHRQGRLTAAEPHGPAPVEG